MVALVENVLGSISGSLPYFKISNWTVKIKKERKLNPLDADGFSDFMNTIKNDIKWAQESVAGFFQYTEPDMEDIAEFDSFVSLNGNHSSEIVKNVVENGSFRSVNKIKNPDKVVIELAKGGYKAGIEEVLDNLRKYQNSTAFCTIITPFGIIKNLNLIGLEYNFTVESGSNLLVAKITFQEIIYSRNYNKQLKYPSLEKVKNMGRKALEAIGF